MFKFLFKIEVDERLGMGIGLFSFFIFIFYLYWIYWKLFYINIDIMEFYLKNTKNEHDKNKITNIWLHGDN